MNKDVLDNKLKKLMSSGFIYTLGELHRHTGADRCMERESFRKRMSDRSKLYKYEDGYYRCVSITIIAPCELKRDLKKWLRQNLRLMKS